MRHRLFALTSFTLFAVATVVTTFRTATDAAQGGQKATIPIPHSLQEKGFCSRLSGSTTWN
jgi:hypothetical protein